MDIYEAIKSRRSVRSYKTEPVPEDKLMKVLEAVRLAPSGKNGQPWRFVVVRDETLRKGLIPACHQQTFIADAPIMIVACAKESESYQNHGGYMKSFPVDIGIAFDHLMLAAVAEGLGTCWIGAFEEEKVKQVLNIPADLRVVALTPLGFPTEQPAARSRKNMSDIVFYDRFS